MNAVERLLAHGERALRLFGNMYREADLGPLWDEAEPIARRAFELLDRNAGWQGWQSRALLSLAVQQSLDHKPVSGRPAEALRVYRDLLAERRRLLSSKRLRALLAAVVEGSAAWGGLARDVVRRAEAVADAVERLRSLPGDPEPWGFEVCDIDPLGPRLWRRLKRALCRLHAFGHPPQAGKPKAKRPSHRPRGVDARYQRELAEGWLTFKRMYSGEGKATKRQYIAERCQGQRKGPAEQAALEGRTHRDLETALKARNRKKKAILAARTK